MKIVVIGGTGLIGSKTVEQLKRRGHEAVAAAPNTGVNTVTGEGLADALAGADVVEQKGSHAIFLSQPKAVVALVEKAAKSLSSR